MRAQAYAATFEEGVTKQMLDMAQECVKYRALPMLLVAIDGSMKGHLMWPDEIPPEIEAAFPALLADVLDELREYPVEGR